MSNKTGRLIPALYGGGFIAVFSTLPVLKYGNCLCCLWVALGGALGVWIYRKRLPAREVVTSQDGASIGLLSGVYGALFGMFLEYLLLNLTGADPSAGLGESVSRIWKDMPEEFSESMGAIRSMTEHGPFAVTFRLITLLLVDSVFATAGGLAAVSWYRKRMPRPRGGR